jgi:hypothetical protein
MRNGQGEIPVEIFSIGNFLVVRFFLFTEKNWFVKEKKSEEKKKGAGSVWCLNVNCVWRGFLRFFDFCIFFLFIYFFIRYLWMCHCWPDLGSKFCRGLQMN